jgi:hypothetical protein
VVCERECWSAVGSGSFRKGMVVCCGEWSSVVESGSLR